MNTILNIMDKIYGDSKTLSIIYIIGAVLLFIFIILLIFSLRKPDKKLKTKIIEEPKIDDEKIIEKNEIENNQENIKEEKNMSIPESIFEKTTIIPLEELKRNEEIKTDIIKTETGNEENKKNSIEADEIELKNNDEISNISSEIPDVDEYVDNIVNKTYEKNEQFSSVYIDNNTSRIKLDKVMENLNVDENVLNSIVPEEEKTFEKEKKKEEIKINEIADIKEDKDINNNLNDLKKALEEKKKEVDLKQDDLKAKLENLKQTKQEENTLKQDDLLNKLNSIKENK